MSRKKLVPVLFEIHMVNFFAFLLLISISQLEDFVREVFQVHKFGTQDSDRLIIGMFFIAYMISATKETAKRPQASEKGFGSILALILWTANFSCLLAYEKGKYFPDFCNKDTALLYVSFSCLCFMSAFMHPKREEVPN